MSGIRVWSLLFRVYLLVSLSLAASSYSSIKAVAILFRHGSRTPLNTGLFSLDQHYNYSWPGGLNALTPVGIKQLYNSGVKLRKRYGSLIPMNGLFSKDYMRVNSSDADRCLMSGQSFLAGFLPPTPSVLDIPFQWQPVPIYSTPRIKDYLLSQRKPCPNYDVPFAKLNLTDPEVMKILGDDVNFIEQFKFNTGKKDLTIQTIIELQDTIQIEIDNGLARPSWLGVEDENKLMLLTRLSLKYRSERAEIKIRGGALLDSILTDLNQFKNGSSTINTIINSAHDSTLIRLMKVMDILDQTEVKPEYAATLVIELHENVKLGNDFEIKIFYFRNSEDDSPIEVKIPNCPAPCSLYRFNEVMQSKLVKNYDIICGNYILI